MDLLPLFPKSGFDQSTTTPVLVGVLISWIFTECFGWVFAGLVVPGYLAAVFLLDPRAAFIDVVEAVFTYLLARGIGEWLPRTGLTSRVFGRERFFLVVLASILVRLAVEGALLPRLLPHATWAFSIGLVVVPLAANACWKTGLARGAIQNGVPTLLTYLVLRFVLVPYTNLSLAGFELATENIEASFLSSPKAYIVLITGAVLAAMANLRYGWDFNGILVPALLALVVIEPVKFVATFVEVGVLLAVMAVLFRTTPLGRMNTEGPRKTVLFFSVDYALRFAFAWGVGRVLPGGDVVELMGFGYLLPTLLAVKASSKGSVALVLFPVLNVSLAAFALGSLIGFGATLFDRADAAEASLARAEVTRRIGSLPHDPAAAALWLGALARPPVPPEPGASGLTPPRAIAALVEGLSSPVADARALAIGFEVQRIDRDVAVLRERFETAEGRRGEPMVLASTASLREAPLVGLVLHPIAAPGLAPLGGRLLGEKLLDALVVAGVDEVIAPDRAPQDAARSLALLLARVKNGGAVVELTLGSNGFRSSVAPAGPRASRLLTAVQARLGRTSSPAEGTEDAPARLEIPRDALDSWLESEVVPRPDPVTLASSTAMAVSLDGLTGSPVTPSLEEVLVLRHLLLVPLLGGRGKPSLAALRFAAETLSYRLHGPTPLPDGEPGLALLPAAGSGPIAVVVRASGVKGAVIELPQGDREGPRDLALRLGAALGTDAILLALEPRGPHLLGTTTRVAHDIATAPDAARGGTPATLVVRETEANGGIVAVGAWGGSGDAMVGRTKTALALLGVPNADAPLDDDLRDLGARSVFGEGGLVGLTADAHALRASSLDAARRAARVFAGTGVTVADGPVGDVAADLVRLLPPLAVSPGLAAPLTVARRAALEESVAARRALTSAIATTATRAALARAPTGEYLVIVSRDARGIAIGASPTDPHAPPPDPSVVAVTSVAACAEPLHAGGACHVSGAR